MAILDQVNGLLLKTDQRTFSAKGVMEGTKASVTQLTAHLTEARASLLKIDGVLAKAQVVATNAHGQHRSGRLACRSGDESGQCQSVI